MEEHNSFFIFIFLRLPWSQRRLWALDFLIVLRLRKTKGTFAFCITKWPWWIFMRNARPVPQAPLASPNPPSGSCIRIVDLQLMALFGQITELGGCGAWLEEVGSQSL